MRKVGGGGGGEKESEDEKGMGPPPVDAELGNVFRVCFVLGLIRIEYLRYQIV